MGFLKSEIKRKTPVRACTKYCRTLLSMLGGRAKLTFMEDPTRTSQVPITFTQ